MRKALKSLQGGGIARFLLGGRGHFKSSHPDHWLTARKSLDLRAVFLYSGPGFTPVLALMIEIYGHLLPAAVKI